LAGSGTTAPTYDFKGIYSRLSDDYRTVVVERAGYVELPPPRLMMALVAFTARTGLLRLAPFICHGSDVVNQGHLTDEETAAYCAIMYRRTLSANMLAEVDITQANAKLVAAGLQLHADDVT
jgi:hypothetical protein